MNDTLLVTGGAGFIGSHFCRLMLSAGDAQVVNVDKLTYAGNLANLGPLAHDKSHLFVEGDIVDRHLVSALLHTHRPKAIVHFAAESHVDRSIDGPQAFVQTNVVGTHVLLQAAYSFWLQLSVAEQQRFRFLHVSTDEVYGSAPGEVAFREGDSYSPTSPYAASKAAADHFVSAFGKTYGLPVLISHCTNNYGPYQYPEKLIPLTIHNAICGLPLPVYGDGQQVRDWLYVGDHCTALQTILNHGRAGQVYHISGDSPRTNLQVVTEICRLVDKVCHELPHTPCESLIRLVRDRPAHDRRYCLDHSKLTRELAWTPQTSFEDGLRKTVEWYVNNQDWVSQVTDGRYGFERLGLAALAGQ